MTARVAIAHQIESRVAMSKARVAQFRASYLKQTNKQTNRQTQTIAKYSQIQVPEK